MNKEQWKDIIGYEGLYCISNLGRVKSLKWGKERILKGGKYTHGYLQIGLSKEGKKKWFLVHRLVYQTFVGEILEGMQVNHIDEDKENNRVDNLNLMTAKENCNHGTRNQRSSEKRSKQVIQLSLDGVELARYPSTKEIERTLGFAQGNISKCCIGKLKTAYKFKWRYA